MTFEQYCEAVRVHRIRTDTPSLSELAREWGLPNSTVAFGVRRGIKRYDIRMHNESLGSQESANAREAD
jgi:hypothetical protein